MPKTLWLLGPTSAGKTTIARRAIEVLHADGVPALHFDGDEVRDWFGPTLDFSAQSRGRVVNTLIDLANKGNDSAIPVIVSALTAHEETRAEVRERVNNLSIVYVYCSIESCAERDPKGLYARAKNGEIDTLIGYNSPYVPPSDPDLMLNTENESIDESARQLLSLFSVDKE